MFTRSSQGFCLSSIDWCSLAEMINFGWAGQGLRDELGFRVGKILGEQVTIPSLRHWFS